MSIENKSLRDYCLNPDGVTYNGVKLVQWMYESTTGKALSLEDAELIVQEAKARAEAKRALPL